MWISPLALAYSRFHVIALPYFGFPRLTVATAYYRHIPREPEALPEISSVFIPGAMEQYRSVKPKKGFHREKQEGMWLDGLEGTADTYKAMVLGPDYEEREANAALESQSELLMSLTFQLSSELHQPTLHPCAASPLLHCTVLCCEGLSDSMLERDGRVEELGLPDDPIFSKYFFLRSATYNNIALSVAEPWPIPPALGMEMSRFLQGMGQRVFVFVSVMNSATIQGVAEVVSVTNEPQPVTFSDGSSGPPMARANVRQSLVLLSYSFLSDVTMACYFFPSPLFPSPLPLLLLFFRLFSTARFLGYRCVGIDSPCYRFPPSPI